MNVLVPCPTHVVNDKIMGKMWACLSDAKATKLKIIKAFLAIAICNVSYREV